MSSAPSRNSRASVEGAVGEALCAAVALTHREISRAQTPNPVVLIDGGSGAGKSSLARALVSSWSPPGPVQSVALDSIYPGWDGLQQGVDIARRDVLLPHARGLVGVWRRFDWAVNEEAEAHAVDPSLPLIVEGSGIITAATKALCDVAVWVESPEPSRKARALVRDGDSYAPHWDRWAAQERAHAIRDEPVAKATLIVRIP